MKRLVALLIVSLLSHAGGAAAASISGEGATPKAPAAGEIIEPRCDLNAASSDDLLTLPGIGPALAARIVALREKKGGFRNLEELTEVKGIGAAKFARLRPFFTLTAPSSPMAIVPSPNPR